MFLLSKANHNNQENGNHTKEDDDYTFATHHEAHLEAICNWIQEHRTT
jgi:hypothetical protein